MPFLDPMNGDLPNAKLVHEIPLQPAASPIRPVILASIVFFPIGISATVVYDTMPAGGHPRHRAVTGGLAWAGAALKAAWPARDDGR